MVHTPCHLTPFDHSISIKSLSMAALACVVLCPIALAVNPVVYIDSSGSLSTFGRPHMNDAGVMAFTAGLDAGGTGVFVAGEIVSSMIVSSAGSFDSFAGPAIDNSEKVSFFARKDLAPGDDFMDTINGVYHASGGVITTLAETPTFGGQYTLPAVNGPGLVVFARAFPAGTSSHHVFNGVSVETIPFGLFETNPAIRGVNSHGAVLTTGGPFNGAPVFNTAVINGPGPTASVQADAGYAINDSGVVLIRGSGAGGSTLFTGILTGNTFSIPNTFTPIADVSGAYSGFTAAEMNNAGLIAFEASLDGGGKGIFMGSDPVANKVIQTGDLLFDLFPITNVELGSLNDFGLLSFRYELSNGVQGLAVMQVPEPALLPALAGLSLVLGLTRRRRAK